MAETKIVYSGANPLFSKEFIIKLSREIFLYKKILRCDDLELKYTQLCNLLGGRIPSLDNLLFFRLLFLVSFCATILITNWISEFNSLYILTVIFLGLGFSEKSRLFIFVSCCSVVFTRTFLNDEFVNITAVLVRLFVYLAVTFISSEVIKKYYEIKHHQTELVFTLAKSLDSRDSYTANHSEKAADYALKIAREMELPKKQCEAIYIGGLLHDIGKIGVPEVVLLKPSRLTDDEFEFIKLHPTIGYETLKHISDFKRNGVLDMVLYHHERYDGNGYPHGLKKEEIPLAARILAVADSFDAMTTKRVYKPIMDLNYAMGEIEKNIGSQFDPQAAKAFLAILEREGMGIFEKKQPGFPKII